MNLRNVPEGVQKYIGAVAVSPELLQSDLRVTQEFTNDLLVAPQLICRLSAELLPGSSRLIQSDS